MKPLPARVLLRNVLLLLPLICCSGCDRDLGVAFRHHKGRQPDGLLREVDSTLTHTKHSGISEDYSEFDFVSSSGAFSKRIHVGPNHTLEWEDDAYSSGRKFVSDESGLSDESLYVQYKSATERYRVTYIGTDRELLLALSDFRYPVEGTLEQVREKAQFALKRFAELSRK